MKIRGQESRPDQVTVKNVLKLPYYVARGIKYHAAGRFYIPKPVYATLRVTRRCNSRCVMCSDWKRQDSEEELTLTEIGEIFRNPLFSLLERFVLSGGEPTLRDDLVQIAQTVLKSCPQIKEVGLITNGLEPALVIEKVKNLLALSQNQRLTKFSVSVSLDGYGPVHEKVRRVPQAFERTTETIKRLKGLQLEIPFYLCSTCVIQPFNVDNLAQLSEFGQELGLPINFVPVCVSDFFVDGHTAQSSLRLTNVQLNKLRTFFDRQLQSNLVPSNVAFMREYFNVADGKKRRLPCFLLHHYAGLSSDGTLYGCPADSSLAYGNLRKTPLEELWYSDTAREIRKRTKENFCSGCTIYCDMPFAFSHEFFEYAKFLFKENIRGYLGK